MTKAAGRHKPSEHPRKPEYVSPKQPFRKRKKVPGRASAIPLAAATALAVLSMPGDSKSGTLGIGGALGKKPAAAKATSDRGSEIGLNMSPSIAGEYAFNGGRATIEEVPRTDQNIFEARYRIEFHIEGKRFPIPVRFNAPPPNSLGNPISIFFSKTRTVILTYNYLLVVQGYEDVLENPETLQMDGRRLDGNSFWVRLPQGLRGGNTISSAAADGPTGEMTVLFALGGDALWSFRTDVEGGNPVKEDVSLSGRASLHRYGRYAFLFQPESQEDFVSVYRRDDESGANACVATFPAARGASSGEGATVSEIPGGMMFSAGNRTAIVLFDEATSSFTVATAAPND